MNAVITKKQKNTIMILGGIAGLIGALAGTSGIVLRAKYLEFDQDWDVDEMAGFTDGYFGVMSGFTLLLLGTLGYAIVYSRISYLVFIYWLLSLSCDTLCILDTMMVMPYTKENGKYAWEGKPDCNSTINQNSTANSTSPISNTKLHLQHAEYCKDFEVIAILLLVITASILASLFVSTITTFVTSVALCKARSIANAEQAEIQLAPFSTPEHFQPMSFNNTVYHTDGFRK